MNFIQYALSYKHLPVRSSFLGSIAFLAFFYPGLVFSATLTQVSDTIVDSRPASSYNDHTFRFVVPTGIPISGSVTIVPEGGVTIPPAFDHNDIDFAVGPSPSGPFSERSVGAVATGAEDGVTIVTGASGSVRVNLNSSTAIAPGSAIKIVLGAGAEFGVPGAHSLVNSSTTGSFRVRVQTRDAGNTLLDSGTAMFAIIESTTVVVDTTDVFDPLRTEGLPSGLLPGGTTAVWMSIQTDRYANCRYSTTPNTIFSAMTNTMIPVGSNQLHYVVLSGLVEGGSYTYYVRCENNGHLANATDYPIAFDIGVVPLPDTPIVPPGSGGGSSGNGQPRNGPFRSGGPFLGKADLLLEGYAIPSSRLTILRDGKKERELNIGGTGAFSQLITDLERGTYTLGLYAVDGVGRKTSTYAPTVSLIANTVNAVRPILISPTISSATTTVGLGESIQLSGLAIPNFPIEVILNKQGQSATGNIIQGSTTPSVGGAWSLSMDTEGLEQGTYEVKARSIMSPREASNFSPLVYVGIGESPNPDLGLRADLNKDTKVNITDFSILLFNWATSDSVADIDMNGIVNLADFSIMLFYWTG